MNSSNSKPMALLFGLCLFASGCSQTKGNAKAEAPPPTEVEHEQDVSVVKVDHPEQFPLVTAAENP